jgi:hypothetical protein
MSKTNAKERVKIVSLKILSPWHHQVPLLSLQNLLPYTLIVLIIHHLPIMEMIGGIAPKLGELGEKTSARRSPYGQIVS